MNQKTNTPRTPRKRTHANPNRSNRRPGNRQNNNRRSGPPRKQTAAQSRARNASPKKKKDDIVPPITEGVRIIALGGVEEVGRNMTIVETPDDIFVVDAGFQFSSDENVPGIDYILPNTKYLEERKDKIRAVLVTHAHLDHIGGIPFILDRIGNPPIYTLYLTSIMIKKRQEEFPHKPKIDIKVVDEGERFKIGSTYIRTFPVMHSIPDSVGFIVETKEGNVVISGDMKLDHKDGVPTKEEADKWGAIGKENNLIFIADSTNAENAGFSIPESIVHTNIEEIITQTKGRLIVGTFASQFARMINIIQVSEKLGKKIVTEGRSIKNNIEIAQKAGLIKPKKGTIISSNEMDNYPAEKIVVIATGAQGEEHAALMRISTKRHKSIRLMPQDTVVLSSSVIPGNELAVQKLKDNLYRHNVKLLHYRSSDVHSTGHGNAGELVWINQQVNAKYFMPAYGYYSMTYSHQKAVVEAGFPKENIVLADNGTVVDILPGEKLKIHKEKAPSDMLIVDGFNIGDSVEVVMRDRQTLASDGILVLVALVNTKTGKLKKSPDIFSRGFVYLQDSQELLQQTRLIAKKTVEGSVANMHPIDFDYIRKELAEAVGSFLLQKTNKAPVIGALIIGV